MDTAVASVKWCAVAAGAAFIGVVSGILFLQEREKVLAWLEKKSSFQKGRKLLKGLGKDIKEYLKAQVKILAVTCAVCAAGLWLLDIRGAVGYGILIGLLDALPILGTGTFLVPWGSSGCFRGKRCGAQGCSFCIWSLPASANSWNPGWWESSWGSLPCWCFCQSIWAFSFTAAGDFCWDLYQPCFSMEL